MQKIIPNHKANKHKVWKWIGGILAVLILIGLGLGLYLNARWKPILTKKLKEGVRNRSLKLYKLDFKDITINPFTGSAALYQVSLTPDTVVYNQLKANQLAPANIFKVKLARLQISRIALLRAYFKREIDMKAIVLEQPSIQMIHYKVKPRPEVKKEALTLYQMISNQLKSINVRAIKIIDADFDYVNGETSQTLNSVKHLSINVKDFLVDSLSQFDTTRYYHAKDIGFQLTGYKSIGKNKMYTIKVDTVSGTASGKNIVVKGVQIIPMYPDLTFTRKYTYGKDRYDLKFNQISFTGVDFARLDSEGSLHAEALKIGPAKVNIFVNRELPAPPKLDKVRNFPHVALKRLPFQAIVDTIKLNNVDVAYTEYNPISQRRGTAYFQNLSGRILNVTNDSLQLAKNNHAIANLSALVMKTSRIDIRINFNLTDKNAAFSYKGTVGPMNMLTLNPMAKNMGLIEIESGKMQKINFNIQANAKGSSGTVHFYYTDLKIKLLKEGEDGAAPKRKGFLSFLVNTILIKNANPDKNEAPRTANVTFQRTPAASFFNLLWKGVFLGMRETVGIGAVPVKTPEESMKKIKAKKEERKKEQREKNKD
ncbi:AsmA family protein [Pedobacter nyackensis]|uniref:DUF748 domain-containing protein n=1 Tax=Pedobacter nyackensis TaxID=475255 RepID=A0A1W2BEV9_9SPHI|nr:hypothetical protein [Pedobacter nyackensis]SMC71436.1 hypothetical protein SAMN04488101_102409 [Pedobacter nyackensis]